LLVAQQTTKQPNNQNGSLRGWHWRGRDCNALTRTVYPGRRLYDRSVRLNNWLDHNCNGVDGWTDDSQVSR
jgi:acyloxyacyl hydrolase